MTPSEAKAAEKRLRASAEWRAQSDGHDQEYRNFVEAADALASMIAEVERLTTIPEEVEGLCKQLEQEVPESGPRPDTRWDAYRSMVPETVVASAAAALRAYAAREADRGRVDAGSLLRFGDKSEIGPT